MSGPLRILFPRRGSPGHDTSGRHLPTYPARGPVRSWFRQLLRAGAWIALFMLVTSAILVAGFPELDPMAALQWMEESWVLLLTIRISVYLVVIWYGPILRGVQGGDLDRARLALAGCAALIEVLGSLRLIL